MMPPPVISLPPDLAVPAHAIVDLTLVADAAGNVRAMAHAKCLTCRLVVDPTTYRGEYWWCRNKKGLCCRHAGKPGRWERLVHALGQVWKAVRA